MMRALLIRTKAPHPFQADVLRQRSTCAVTTQCSEVRSTGDFVEPFGRLARVSPIAGSVASLYAGMPTIGVSTPIA